MQPIRHRQPSRLLCPSSHNPAQRWNSRHSPQLRNPALPKIKIRPMRKSRPPLGLLGLAFTMSSSVGNLWGSLGNLFPRLPAATPKAVSQTLAMFRRFPHKTLAQSRLFPQISAFFRLISQYLAVSRVISQYVIPSCSRLFQEFPFVAQSFLFLHFFALFFSKLPFSSFSFLLFPKTERRNNREMQSGGRTGKVLALYKLSCPLKRRGGLAYSPAAQRLEQKP